ncbi:glycosyltransferase family 2 protein [Candidatus Gracilibacteria bacterium]|nr:glycosyltransferase family 2 protein [Candidatus Gracilibacteria bacterium]
MHRFKTLTYWLAKIPLIALLTTVLFPLILMQIHYETGLFFIAFYISYWSVKVFESYYYVLKSYFKLLRLEKKDWTKDKIVSRGAKKLKHIVIVPIYTEPYNVIEENIIAIQNTYYPFKKNIIVLLATEERAPHGQQHAERIIREHGKDGVEIVNIVHPADIEGEGKVKGANITHAIREYEKIADLDPKNTFVSTIDTDTKVEKNFFMVVTSTFLQTDERDHAIYQYTPIYSNNWREGHFFARIIGIGTTMWQFFESQNPEFYRNFAVYGQTLACLHKANYWSLTSIVEDGMQYWRSYFGWDSFFRIIHTPAICEMDLVDEKNLYRTMRSQYKQLRRWSWGCSDIEYVLPEFIKNEKISNSEKIRKTIYLVYNHLFWAGGPFMLFFIGYVPGVFSSIDHSLATFTVPIASSLIFTVLFATVIIPSILSIHIMRRYTTFTPLDYVWNMIQWITVPVLTLTLFSIPAIESQIRLFFGKRIDSFDTTEKMERKNVKL